MESITTQSGLWETLQYFLPKVFFAVICGGLVGLERELKNKPAGIKTNILICLGAALYTSISVLISQVHSSNNYYGDPARIAAQIVSGIGFLGGGAIIQSRGTVLGLTTAATIWVVAAIGVCIGIGYTSIAVSASILVVLVLVATNFFEDRILGRSLTFACEIVCHDPDGSIRLAINTALAKFDLTIDDFDIAQKGEDTELTLRYSGHRADNKRFILELWGTVGIKEVKQT